MLCDLLQRAAVVISVIAALSYLGWNDAAAQSGNPGASALHPGVDQILQAAAQGGANRAPLQKNLSLVGFLPIPSLTSDVWAHGDFAYVGGFTSNTTVKIVDISDPTNPSLVTELQSMDGASPQDVKVARINTRYFRGDLLVVVNEGGNGGIQLWDVSTPANPVLLSEKPFTPQPHNAYLYQKGRRAFVLLAIEFAEVLSGPNPFDPLYGDFVVVEVTDPTNPQVVGDWGAAKDGGFPFGVPGFPGSCDICRGASPSVFLHDVWASENGKTAYLSYWDLGLILLDISDPTNPTFIGRGIEPPTFGGDEGNAHNAVPAQGGNLVLVSDEDFAPGPWGFLRLFDTSDPTNPVQISAFATPGALGSGPAPASMHNIIVRGSRAYLSWYFEGIRVVDFSQPTHPREIAAFTPDPVQTSPGLFWGIYVHKNLILGSDLLGGLFILKLDGSARKASLAAGETTTAETPTEFALLENYPNPFNPTTTIPFAIPERSEVRMAVYDVLGREVRILAQGVLPAGEHRVEFDADDLPSGLYLVRFSTPQGSFTRTMQLTK